MISLKGRKAIVRTGIQTGLQVEILSPRPLGAGDGILISLSDGKAVSASLQHLVLL